jgi:phage repressor protein C with HTH and peptisase S24 domain
MKAIDRVFQYIDFNGINKSELERKTGISNGYLAKQLQRKADIGESILINILEYCPDINPEWLLLGRGEMLKQNVEYSQEEGNDLKHTYNNSQITKMHKPTKYMEKILKSQEITLYDIRAAANLKTLFIEKNQNILGKIRLPNISKCDGAMHIIGDSMEPYLKAGDIICYKEIYDTKNIIWGEMYLVAMDVEGDEYLTVKYITPSDKGEDWVCLKSHNSLYSPQDFELRNINAIAIIKASIKIHTM